MENESRLDYQNSEEEQESNESSVSWESEEIENYDFFSPMLPDETETSHFQIESTPCALPIFLCYNTVINDYVYNTHTQIIETLTESQGVLSYSTNFARGIRNLSLYDQKTIKLPEAMALFVTSYQDYLGVTIYSKPYVLLYKNRELYCKIEQGDRFDSNHMLIYTPIGSKDLGVLLARNSAGILSYTIKENAVIVTNPTISTRGYDGCNVLAMSPDKKFLATTCDAGVTILYKYENQEYQWYAVINHGGYGLSISFDSTKVVSSDARWIKVFAISDGACLSTLECQHYTSPKFHPTLKDYLFTSTFEGISIFDMSKPQEDMKRCLVQFLAMENGEFSPWDSYPFCFSSDQKKMYFGTPRNICVFNIKLEKTFFERIHNSIHREIFADCVILTSK